MNLLIRPIVTEKTLAENASGRYAFEVDKTANKMQIKNAVERQFAVKVLGVKTVTIPGRTKRNRRNRKLSFGGKVKKAIVRILPDQKIDLFEAETSQLIDKKKS